MAKLTGQLAQQRIARDEARALLDFDIESLKEAVKPEKFTKPMAEKARSGAQLAKDNSLPIGAGLGALLVGIVGWVYRKQIMEVIGEALADRDEDLALDEASDD